MLSMSFWTQNWTEHENFEVVFGWELGGKSLEELGAGVWWYRLVISHDKNVLLETAQISLKVWVPWELLNTTTFKYAS